MTVPHSPVIGQDCIDAYYQCTSQVMSTATGNAYASSINANIITWAQYVDQCVEAGEQNRQPALLCQNYTYGAPTNLTQLNNNANFCQTQYNYYVSIGAADPGLGPYEALMRAYAGAGLLNTKWSGMSNQQIWQDLYTYGFNTTMSQAQIAHFDAQYNYFYGLYTNAGLSPSQADIEAKGAVAGQIMGFSGALTEGSILDNKAETWFQAAVAANSPTFGTPL